MTARWLLAGLALGLGAAFPASAADESVGSIESVESFVDSEMPASGVPGLAFAVVTEGEVTTVGARGVVRAGDDEEVTPDTPFLTGSISKSFTALAVMQLVEAGKVDLDAELAGYLDGFAAGPAGVITIRQLLSHTSGFSTLQGNASHPDVGRGQDALERRVDQLTEVAPAHAPDETWEYSNLNYQVLGRLVEVVSGEEFQAYVSTHVLEPVGMGQSFVADGEAHESMATGHTPWFGTKRPRSDSRTDRATAPQGGVVASARDLARYLQMMMNGKDDVLSAEGKALMMRPASPVSPYYGLGWFLDPANGSVSHSGTSPGFDTLATMVPSDNRAAVVLLNGGSGLGFGETAELRWGLTARALDLDHDGEGSRLPQKALFVGLVLLPVLYLLSAAWAWLRRGALRAKTSTPSGLFSLWFPLLTTVAGAWVILHLVPSLFGTPLGNIRVFQPDVWLTFVASAVTGVLWAVFRLGVAYTGRSRPALMAHASRSK